MAKNTFNFPLYNYAVGWFNRVGLSPLEFIAPSLACPAVTGSIKRYPQGYAFRVHDTERPLYEAAKMIAVGAEDVPYLLIDRALRVPIDDSELETARLVPGGEDQLVQSRTATLLANWRTSGVKEGFDFFRKEITAKEGVGAWSGAAAEPISELKALIREFQEVNGVKPNRILFSDAAWDVLSENGSVLDLIAYNDAKALDANLLLKLLGFKRNTADATEEMPRIMAATVPVGTVKPGPGVPFHGSNLLGSDVWMTFVDEGNQIGNMCGMRTLHCGGESPVEKVESYYVREKHTTFHEVAMHRNFAVTAPSCNIRLSIS